MHPLRRKGIEEYTKELPPPPPSAKAKLEDWRLAELTRAWRKQSDAAFTVEHAEALSKVAASECDLHQATTALEAGCDPLTLERIFT